MNYQQIRSVLLNILMSIAIASDGFCADTDDLVLATGSKAGVYYPIGKGISVAAGKAGIKLSVKNSEGSQQNLMWLAQGRAHLCIAQSDTVYNAYNGRGRFSSSQIRNIRGLISLYPEVVHILVRKSLHIENIQGFRGKRISLGLEGSGTESNARAILEISGISSSEYDRVELKDDEIGKAFAESKLDIAFMTSGLPSKTAQRIMQDKNAYLFELKPQTLERLIDEYPFYVHTAIPASTYSNNPEDISAVGVSALLIGRDDLSPESVHGILKAIIDNTEVIAGLHAKGGEINLASAFKGLTIPISDGARAYFEDAGLYRIETYLKIMNTLLILSVLAGLIASIVKFKKIKKFFMTKDIVRVFASILIVWIVGSSVLYYFEHKINEEYSNVILALWGGLVNLVSFGEKEPITAMGRVTATTMMVIGIGAVAWLTGEIASVFVHKKLTGGKRRMERMKDHFVMINWNSKGYGVIEQIHNPIIADKRPIIVISDTQLSLPERDEYDDTYTIIGNPTSEKILERANVHSAHSIIILADELHELSQVNLSKEQTNQIADSKSVMIVLCIKRLCKTKGISPPKIIIEILDPQKVNLAEYAGTANGDVKIISSSELGKDLIAQAAINPELVDIYMDLLTFSATTNEIYKWKVPKEIIDRNMTRNEFFKWVLDLRDKDVNIVPIGVLRNGKTYINSRKVDLDRMQENDYFFSICYSDKELRKMDKLIKDI